MWDKDDRVWVYSGDIGTFFLEQNPETKKWEQYSYSESNATAPDFLQKVKPTYFSVPLEVATLERPAISPSGKYILAVISEWHKQARWLRFKVLNQKKQVLYTPPERFAARRITHILWDRYERIWVSSYSTAYFWERKKDNDWVKYKYNTFDDKVPKPDFLEWLI